MSTGMVQIGSDYLGPNTTLQPIQAQNKRIDHHDLTFQKVISQQQTAQTNLQQPRGMIYAIEQKLSACHPTPKTPQMPCQPGLLAPVYPVRQSSGNQKFNLQNVLKGTPISVAASCYNAHLPLILPPHLPYSSDTARITFIVGAVKGDTFQRYLLYLFSN